MKKKHFAGAYVSVTAILLSCLGAVSVGFASWVITQGDSSTATGTIHADSIDTNINGLNIASNGPLTFSHYFFQSASNSNQFNQEYATIVYTISYANDGSLPLDGSLSFSSGLALFNATYLTSVKFGAEEGSNLNYEFASNHDAITFNITATSTPQHLRIQISNKMIAKYGDEMKNGKFYLRLEAE